MKQNLSLISITIQFYLFIHKIINYLTRLNIRLTKRTSRLTSVLFLTNNKHQFVFCLVEKLKKRHVAVEKTIDNVIRTLLLDDHVVVIKTEKEIFLFTQHLFVLVFILVVSYNELVPQNILALHYPNKYYKNRFNYLHHN